MLSSSGKAERNPPFFTPERGGQKSFQAPKPCDDPAWPQGIFKSARGLIIHSSDGDGNDNEYQTKLPKKVSNK